MATKGRKPVTNRTRVIPRRTLVNKERPKVIAVSPDSYISVTNKAIELGIDRKELVDNMVAEYLRNHEQTVPA